MLLPFSAIPSTVTVSEPKVVKDKVHRTRSKVARLHRDSSGTGESDSDQSESVVHVPKYVLPARRNDSSQDHQGTSVFSITPTLSDTALSVHSDTTHNLSMVDSNRSHSISDFNPVITSISNDNTQSVSLNTDSNQSRSSFSGSTPAGAPQISPRISPQSRSPRPRRSARVRVPPDRYGEWIVNQQSVVEPDTTQIWYV